MSESYPRRRADDWRATSEVSLSRKWLYDIARELGYDARDIESIRMNTGAVIVCVNTPQGMRSTRHPMGDSTTP